MNKFPVIVFCLKAIHKDLSATTFACIMYLFYSEIIWCSISEILLRILLFMNSLQVTPQGLAPCGSFQTDDASVESRIQ